MYAGLTLPLTLNLPLPLRLILTLALALTLTQGALPRPVHGSSTKTDDGGAVPRRGGRGRDRDGQG